MKTKKSGPPPQTARPSTTCETPYLTLPTARTYAGPPVPGRSLWALSVLSCPLCSAMHQHRTGLTSRLLSGRLTRSCPTTGRPYVLAPVQRRREARRAHS